MFAGVMYELVRSSPSEIGDDRIFLAIERVQQKPQGDKDDAAR